MTSEKTKTDLTMDRDDPQVYSRPRWRHGTRVFGAVMVILFNLTTVMSNVDRYRLHKLMPFEREVAIYVMLLFCDLVILAPIIFEVDMLKITADKLILKTTFFRVVIPWTQVIEFRKPRALIYGMIRTNRCFYLINRRWFDRFDKLAQDISAHANTVETK